MTSNKPAARGLGVTLFRESVRRISEGRALCTLAFLAGTAIRAVPNLISPHPIGFDTVYYMAQIVNAGNFFADLNTVFKTPLFVLLIDTLSVVTSLDPASIMRLVPPLLFGVLAASFYAAARTLFQWSPRWSFVASLIFILQTATLRLSWDLMRNLLGLALLLVAVTKLKTIETNPLAFSVASLLVVLSHEITAIILLIIVSARALGQFRQGNVRRVKTVVLASLPAATLFALVFLHAAEILVLPSPEPLHVFPTILPIPGQRSLPLPFVNYLAGEGSVSYQSYLHLLADVASLYVASFLPLLPFIVMGYWRVRDETMEAYTAVCAFPALHCVISPEAAVLLWHRWMQMLIVPYTFYAVHGLMNSHHRFPRVSIRRLTAITCSVYALVAVLYVTTPASPQPVSIYALLSPASRYSPASMLSNTVPVDDTPHVVEAFQWLDANMEDEACLLAGNVFSNWAKLSLDARRTVIDYRGEEVGVGVNYALSLNFTAIYWVWWANGVGLRWYNQAVPETFTPRYASGDIVVYQLEIG